MHRKCVCNRTLLLLPTPLPFPFIPTIFFGFVDFPTFTYLLDRATEMASIEKEITNEKE